MNQSQNIHELHKEVENNHLHLKSTVDIVLWLVFKYVFLNIMIKTMIQKFNIILLKS
jgi:hypothetical protein